MFYLLQRPANLFIISFTPAICFPVLKAVGKGLSLVTRTDASCGTLTIIFPSISPPVEDQEQNYLPPPSSSMHPAKFSRYMSSLPVPASIRV